MISVTRKVNPTEDQPDASFKSGFDCYVETRGGEISVSDHIFSGRGCAITR